MTTFVEHCAHSQLIEILPHPSPKDFANVNTPEDLDQPEEN